MKIDLDQLQREHEKLVEKSDAVKALLESARNYAAMNGHAAVSVQRSACPVCGELRATTGPGLKAHERGGKHKEAAGIE